ncbi:MAG TPA: hypothetical protein VKZ79_23320 [Alphaproteobacteria bacterium]|nr:hypothetical protein [Alphaproteobacteria bacterium]
MAVQPSQNIAEILSTTVRGRTNTGTQLDRSGGQPSGQRQNRVIPEPRDGYDPRAPRGTYVDITA